MDSAHEKSYPVPTHPTWDRVDSTKINDYLDCPRQFFFGRVLGWQSEKPSNHLHFGSSVHLSKEHLLLNGFDAESIRVAYMLFENEYRDEFGPDTDELFEPKTPARYFDCLLQYVDKYRGDPQQYDVLYTEIAGTLSLDNYHILAFRMDSILKDRWDNNMILSLEHKTKNGTLDASWWLDFELSPQVGTYNHVLYSLYDPGTVKGVMINGLGFKKTKSHLFDLDRKLFHRDIDHMQQWQSMMIDHLDRMELDFKTLREEDSPSKPTMRSFPQNPRACTKYWGCRFHNYCTSWTNPLPHIFEPPMGMKVEFWDPLAKEAKNVFKLQDMKVEDHQQKQIEEVAEEATPPSGFMDV